MTNPSTNLDNSYNLSRLLANSAVSVNILKQPSKGSETIKSLGMTTS
jgi:hypothetical protein